MSTILTSLSGFTGFPSKYLRRSLRTGNALANSASSSVNNLVKILFIQEVELIRFPHNFSLGFKAEERQLLNAVGPDGVRGVLLHPAHPLSDLHQLGKGAEGCQVDQGLTLGGDNPRIGSSVFQQKLHAVFIELEGSALKSDRKSITFQLCLRAGKALGERKKPGEASNGGCCYRSRCRRRPRSEFSP